jgi:hypothetical protein
MHASLFKSCAPDIHHNVGHFGGARKMKSRKWYSLLYYLLAALVGGVGCMACDPAPWPLSVLPPSTSVNIDECVERVLDRGLLSLV